MNEQSQVDRSVKLTPSFGRCDACWDYFSNILASLSTRASTSDSLTPPVGTGARKGASNTAQACVDEHYQEVRVAISLLADLIAQGWTISVEGKRLVLRQPRPGSDREEERQRVRQALRISRDEQLTEPSVQNFVRSLTCRRLYNGRWYSIHSLMRDGNELADALAPIALEPDKTVRETLLGEVIQPYLQFVTPHGRCQWTGLRLGDVWRYFRYTWLNPARSTPGRSMMILIRDASVEPHPVIGIAALSSSIVAQKERDEWIGWDHKAVYKHIREDPSDETARWLLRSLDQLLADIRTEDFISEGIFSKDELRHPSEELTRKLRNISRHERLRHQQQIRKESYKRGQAVDDWGGLVASRLYRSKRALALAELLQVRLAFNQTGLSSLEQPELARALQCAQFRPAVYRLARYIKASHVGINMMDISVAGAVAPYNLLLGGKLVSLLLTSPEVVIEYARRYARAPSVIASAMKGERVVRTPHLVLLGTTGLFGGGSSQYNRIRMPASVVGGTEGEIRFISLGGVTTYSTFHISQATMKEIRLYAEQNHQGSDVHGIFGEGVNPKMRKIREALLQLGLPDDILLQAGSPRAVYVIPLAVNFREVLLGKEERPQYVLPVDRYKPAEATQMIAGYWKRRWLVNRVVYPGTLDAVRRHSTTYPSSHGAMVVLPEMDGGQALLDLEEDQRR